MTVSVLLYLSTVVLVVQSFIFQLINSSLKVMSLEMYFVVEFIAEPSKPIEVVAASWCDEKAAKVRWPNHRSQFEFRQLLLSKASPKKSWSEHPMHVLYRSCMFIKIVLLKILFIKKVISNMLYCGFI